jgi:hypothetical protein
VYTQGLGVLVLIDHDSLVPPHEQVARMLREHRQTEPRWPCAVNPHVAKEHDVSHRTTARALETLGEEGLTVSVAAKGLLRRGEARSVTDDQGGWRLPGPSAGSATCLMQVMRLRARPPALR